MVSTKENKELTELLTKLYTLQEEVGAKPKTTTEEKRLKAESKSMAGSTNKSAKTGSKFMEIRATIVERLRKIHGLLEEESQRSKGVMSVAHGNNPKEVIARQTEMREEMRKAQEEWNTLNGIYLNEARKKRSKFSQDQLNAQQESVRRIAEELEKVKQAQMAGYAKNNTSKEDEAAMWNAQAIVTNNAYKFDGDNTFNNASKPSMGPGVDLTADQSVQLQQLKDRDVDFDKTLDEIGEGIKDLSEIAQMQQEEVKRQNVMLERVEEQMEQVQEHVTNVNTKMKETLDEVRGADKICVDIMCIVLMVGLGAVMYQMVKSQT